MRMGVALAALALVIDASLAGAGGIAGLEGTWTVARATMSGEPRADGKVINSTSSSPR